MSGDEWLASVAERMKKEFEDGTVPTPERLTAQELAGKYGYALRGPWINSRIQNRLEELNLRSVPDFSILSNQFALLAEPFLRIGEIEGHLLNLIHRKFTLEELIEAAQRKQIKGSADLTLGDYQHLLGRPEHWERLNLNIDRREFVKHLDRVREIRNNSMHFNPDGLSSEDMQLLRDVARFFDDLVRMGAM